MKTKCNVFVLGAVTMILRWIAFFPSQRVRLFLLRRLFRASIGRDTVLYSRVEIRAPWKLEIIGNTAIGHDVTLDAREVL
jgi:hypothetical protein